MRRGAEPGSPYHGFTVELAVKYGLYLAEELDAARGDLPEAVFRELHLCEPSDDGGNPFGLSHIAARVGPLSAWRWLIWHDGVMRDIGTLGGPDAVMTIMNQRGEMAGQSYASDVPNSSTGIPTIDPFLWRNGKMQDLGTLGGTTGFANWINSQGEVVGQSDLAGDQTAHPFLWNRSQMIDLWTFGAQTERRTGSTMLAMSWAQRTSSVVTLTMGSCGRTAP